MKPGLDATCAAKQVSRNECDVMEAQDSLHLAKPNHSHHAHSPCTPKVRYNVDRVLLSTSQRRRDYMQRSSDRVAKFMVRHDGPSTVVQTWPDSSIYIHDLPDRMRKFPTFHASLVRPFKDSDSLLLPTCRQVARSPRYTCTHTLAVCATVLRIAQHCR